MRKSSPVWSIINGATRCRACDRKRDDIPARGGKLMAVFADHLCADCYLRRLKGKTPVSCVLAAKERAALPPLFGLCCACLSPCVRGEIGHKSCLPPLKSLSIRSRKCACGKRINHGSKGQCWECYCDSVKAEVFTCINCNSKISHGSVWCRSCWKAERLLSLRDGLTVDYHLRRLIKEIESVTAKASQSSGRKTVVS